MKKKIILLTMGETSGIGPEVLIKSFKKTCDKIQMVAISDFYKFKEKAQEQNISIKKISDLKQAEFNNQLLNVLHLDYDAPFAPGKPDVKNSRAVIKSIEIATQLCLNKEADAMVTGPINKALLKKNDFFKFSGHTDYLEYLCNADAHSALMMMLNSELKIIPLTIHIPINEVSKSITKLRLTNTLLTTMSELKYKFGIKNPKIAVLGLNPHSGENGALGSEEILTIKPTLSCLNKKYGVSIDGPFPADGYFGTKAYRKYDVTIAMYHDQALVPLKLLSFFKSVNITLGLPLIRTSPGHGSAIDLAKKGGANSTSFTEAIIMAYKMSCFRGRLSKKIDHE